MLKSKINNATVKPVVISKDIGNKDTIRGYDYFKNAYCNIAILSPKFTGKTTTIYNIVENCIDKDTIVFIFCPSYLHDPLYKKIREMIEKIGATVHCMENFKEGKINHVTNLVDSLQKEAKEKEEAEKKKLIPKSKVVKFDNEEEDDEEKPKKKKKKLLTPKYVCIFDDLSNQMNDSAIDRIFSYNRHFCIKNIVSIHNCTDLSRKAINQTDVFLLFKNQPDYRLDELIDKANITHPKDTKDEKLFKLLYYDATEKPYSFLKYDNFNKEYYQNFDTKYNID